MQATSEEKGNRAQDSNQKKRVHIGLLTVRPQACSSYQAGQSGELCTLQLSTSQVFVREADHSGVGPRTQDMGARASRHQCPHPGDQNTTWAPAGIRNFVVSMIGRVVSWQPHIQENGLTRQVKICPPLEVARRITNNRSPMKEAFRAYHTPRCVAGFPQ